MTESFGWKILQLNVSKRSRVCHISRTTVYKYFGKHKNGADLRPLQKGSMSEGNRTVNSNNLDFLIDR